MDIPKYIGLFLLKNNFVYLHGLGNLELKKKPATYDGDALHAPEYDVVLTPGGSIDDTLANYIATHEQTSISKAANALRDFSTATRAELAAGKEVELPGLGQFVEKNGLVKFVANPHFKHVPPPVPMIKMAKRTEEQPDFRRDVPESSNSVGQVAWGRVALLGLLAAGVLTAGIFAFRYFNQDSTEPAPQDSVVTQPTTTTPPILIDSSQITSDAAPAQQLMPAAAPAGEYVVVLNAYSNRLSADRRVTTLTKNGNTVEVLARDSSSFLVTMRVASSPADTTRMLDSLRRFFNPKGVHILR
jgi:nucleoid DNA-binding protein